MLDKFYAVTGQLKKPAFDPQFEPSQVIDAVTYSEPTTQTATMTVVYLPWHIPDWLTLNLTNRLLQQDSSVLMYEFNPHLLNDNPHKVAASYDHIAQTSSHQVEQLAEVHHTDTVNLLGYSLGNIALAMTASKLRDYATATMVTPGSDLLTSLWNGQRTRRLRTALETAGYSYTKLEKIWSGLGPLPCKAAFRGHPTQILLSERDSFIPFVYGQQLVEGLQADAQSPEVIIKRRTGHVASIAAHILGYA